MLQSQLVLTVLQERGAVSTDKEPLKPGEYDFTGGVPVIDIPRKAGNQTDFVIYDNVTSPDGRLLTQGPGKAYHGSVRDGELHFEKQNIDDNLPFGVIGVYPNDYYAANRSFVADLDRD